nr:serine protease grass-like [Aedes albopictus]
MKSLLSYLIGSIWTVTILLNKVQGRDPNLLPKQCGESVSNRVSRGNETLVFEYPWMAVIRYMEKGRIVDRCAGTLINERYILTAAHCIRNENLHSVILGEHTKGQDRDCNKYYDFKGMLDHDQTDCAEPVEEFGIESFEYHHDFNRPRFSNDIGLIRLNRSVIMKDHIKPICLPFLSELRNMAPLNKYIVTGWGTMENDNPSDVLLQAVLPRVSNGACQERIDRSRLNIQLGSKQMCAGGKNKVDTCKGDSGGPLGFFANHEEGTRFVQFGIVSVGTASCGQQNVPGVYCVVADYMDWILDNMQQSF